MESTNGDGIVSMYGGGLLGARRGVWRSSHVVQ